MDPVSHAFQALGLSPAKAAETAANKTLAVRLARCMAALPNARLGPCGALLYTLASTAKEPMMPYIDAVSVAIGDGRLRSADQVAAAIKYCSTQKGPLLTPDFNAACGVGVTVSLDEIKSSVAALLKEKNTDLEKKRYTMLGLLLGSLRNSNNLKWANSLHVKQELEAQVEVILGPKDDRDDPKLKKKKEKEALKEKDTKKDSQASLEKENTERTISELAKSSKFIFEGELSKMHKAGGNPQLRPDIMHAHLKRTGGRVITRFPPEPNGFLHIGHAKAININFGFAQAHGGITNLRYDDTNPEAEEELYFKAIKDMVEWLGYKPDAITYSSDLFQHLYDLAVELIKRDKAYICHCSGDEIHAQRGGDAKGPRFDSPWRNRPIEESILEFERMKKGEYKEGEAVLRMKMDMQNPNPQFWDLIAYRVMFTKHIRTGTDWIIYPTYDYTHCLCDSFEDITHSFCTTEFTMSRESYYWLVDALELYKPVQWESGRLTIAHTVMSKRKLNQLVTEGIVNGWDDPRMYTLASLKRRGFTPESINAFVRELGVTTANTTVLPYRLEHYVRDHLNQIAPRLFLILDPLVVNITNLPSDYLLELKVPNKPKDESLGDRTLVFTNQIYIDRSDFREVDESNYFRLAPGKTVGLLNVPFPIRATAIHIDSMGNVISVDAEYMDENCAKPKTYIQWIAHSPAHKSPVHLEVRLVSNLFLHANPSSKEDVPDGWLSDINPESMEIIKTAIVDTGILSMKIEDKFQGVRLGYFCLDSDSVLDKGKIVINRTVTLKEDSKKNK